MEIYRPYLFTVAYNILGEVEEAEDIVQEAFAYYLTLKKDHVAAPKPYLTRIVANKSIDRLKQLKEQRQTYPGTWLPEPYMHVLLEPKSDEKDIMSFEVLSAMESLNPVERAVFVLREAFNCPFSELASICNTTEANCRQILSRTRKNMTLRKNNAYPSERIISLMQAFLQAIVDEDINALVSLLKEDIVVYSDGGGKVSAALHPLFGREVVSKFLIGIGRKGKNISLTPSFVQVNHQPAILLSTIDGRPESLITFAGDGRSFNKIFMVRNPDKLSQMMSQKE